MTFFAPRPLVAAFALLLPAAFAGAQTLQKPIFTTTGVQVTAGYLYQNKMHYAGAWSASVERRTSFQT